MRSITFTEFIGSTDFASLVSETAALIDEFVDKDPGKFCTCEEFQKGVTAITQFCTLRAESVKGQLDGTIPSTSDGQSSDSSALIDTSDLNVSDMGTMGKGGGFGGFGGKNAGRSDAAKDRRSFQAANTSNMQPPSGDMPDGFDPSKYHNGEMPEGFDPSFIQNGEMPQGFDGNMPEGAAPPDGQGNDNSSSKAYADNNSRPEMGSFPGMNGSKQKDMGANYILLCVSAIILFAGVVFALKFKR